MTRPLADALARADALNPTASFIVQAPAGSGKTGLLTQRFLRLLTLVQQPEELVAITFTRKAAAEMKNRIVEALHAAQRELPAEADSFARHTRHLGELALRRDQELGWQLLDNPGRLRILTLDALCANLTRQLPILSRLGGHFGIVEDPAEHYQAAARATLLLGKEKNRWSPAIATLLDHLDNHLAKVEALLANLLARREQWLRHIGGQQAQGAEARRLLETVLHQVVCDGLLAVEQSLSELEKEEIWHLAGFAGENLRLAQSASPVTLCHSQAPFPAATPDHYAQWLGIVECLLTKGDTWRKQVNVSNGFPPASQGRSATEKALFTEMKGCTIALGQLLAERPGLREALARVRLLPPPHYTEAQWEILQALLHLLPMAVAQLSIRFQELGQVDFAEIAMRAETALGEPETPTNLAMKVDYQIKHLLVDEFQDTSQGQYRLLERLTAGWSGQDGRTLFVVGDPMQSIYRFREAEVGLFLRAQQMGLGQIRLRPLTLTANFRSQADLVAWVNASFPSIMPPVDDMAAGAVHFHASVPFRTTQAGVAVTVHPFATDDPPAEAAQVVALVRQARQANHKTAILVRARSHLQHILPALSQAGLRYQGIDLASLAQSMVIQDLLSLTRALTCPADRIAWLAILRAPWCGLSLADLTHLAQKSPVTAGEASAPPTLWERIAAPAAWPGLSEDGQWRLARLVAVLTEALQQRRRCQAFPGVSGLCFWIEHTWQALGGPATVPDAQGLAAARQFFALLATTERGGELPDLPGFSQKVAALYAGVDPEAEAGLQVMTIHKAKGLEFDTVILPGLGRSPRSEEKSLLAWMEHPAGLVLGPLKRVDQEQDDPIHAFIRHTEKSKGAFEAGRLLYVATTRARERLHLLGHVRAAGDPPATGSFLHLLWPQVATWFAEDRPPPDESAGEFVAKTVGVPLRRLVTDWSPPPPPPALREQAALRAVDEEPVEFEWAGETVRLVGIVVHRFLHTIAQEGLLQWTPQRLEARRLAYAAHLERLGVPLAQLQRAVGMVKNALLNTVNDERGRWILDNTRHEEPFSELALTGVVRGRPQRLVLDRTFIDREGVRWVIDFKSSWHHGSDLEAFLDNERLRYQEQMARYGMLMQRVSAHPIRLGLYFPMHTGWRAWAM
ncbi:MAG: UvrD-helicase domain-containing protein [Magnetococcales bacterium]|nr:UvrD-helicase domain-containing protein [Magnetococcales bacterium]